MPSNILISPKLYENKIIHLSAHDQNFNNVFIPQGYLNATKMCKDFDREMKFWNNLESTKNLIKSLEEFMPDYQASDYQPNCFEKISFHKRLVININFGSNVNRGTWIHPKLAIDLAAWLDPEFRLWMLDVIQDLMTNGTVQLVESLAKKENVKIEKVKKIKNLNLTDLFKIFEMYEKIGDSEGMKKVTDLALQEYQDHG